MIVNTANVLSVLFGHAHKTLTDEQLEWLLGLTEFNRLEAMNISSTLSSLAQAVGDHHIGYDDITLANILFGLSHRADALSEMIGMSGDADYLLKERKEKQQAEKSETPPKAA